MLTGSWASSLHGVPRSTHDIDLVVELSSGHIELLAKEFPAPEYYLSLTAMRDAVRLHDMFNLLHIPSGDKVDFWLLTDSGFDRSRFSRRELAQLGNASLLIASAEDTILAKLSWAKKSGGSEKQFGDALQVFQLLASLLDHEYLERWVEELQLEELYQRLLNEAGEIDKGATDVPF